MKTEQKTGDTQRKKREVDLGTWTISGFMIGMLLGAVTGNIAQWAGLGLFISAMIQIWEKRMARQTDRNQPEGTNLE